MIVVKDGKAYFHQFNSREGAWEYVIEPDKYQQIDEVIRKWGNPNDLASLLCRKPSVDRLRGRAYGRTDEVPARAGS